MNIGTVKAEAEDVSGQEASLAGRAAWILFAKTVAFAFSFALPLLLVRRLSQHEFGLYKQVFLIVGTALTMLPLGFGMSAYYFLPREPDRQRNIVFNVLLFYTFTAGLACLALFLWPDLLATLFKSSELMSYGPLIGITILFWVLSSFLEIVAVAHQEAKMATAFIICAQFTKAALLLIAAIWFATVEALIYAAIVQGALQTLILLVYLQSRFAGFWREFDWQVLGRQLSYALPLGFAGLLYTMQVDLHSYFVANRFDAATYAVYAVGCFQLPLAGILSESVGSVMIPRVSLLQKNNARREIVTLTASVMRKLSIIYFPLYALLMIVGREFIAVLFTEQYLNSWPIFAINLTLLPFGILVLDPILRAYARQRYFLLKLRIALVGALFVALWLGTKFLPLAGIISIVIVVALVERAVTSILAARLLGVKRRDWALLKDVGKVAAATFIAAALTIPIRSVIAGAKPFVVLVACGCVFSVVYVLVLWLIGLLTPTERAAIRSQITRLRHWPSRRADLLAEGDY